MGIVERLHLRRAVVALVARRDTFGIVAQRVDDLGNGGRIAICETPAIGIFDVRGDQQGEREEAGRETMQWAFPTALTVQTGSLG